MEKLLTPSEQVHFQQYFTRKKHPNQTTDWETICSEAARVGSTIFLSNAYKKLPKEYESDFKLRRRELDPLESFVHGKSEHYRFAIQVSLR